MSGHDSYHTAETLVATCRYFGQFGLKKKKLFQQVHSVLYFAHVVSV